MRSSTYLVLLALAMSCQAIPKPKKVNQMLVEKYFNEHVSEGNDALKDCAEQLHFDEDPFRIPQKIAHLTCHPKSGPHCVQVNLPMEVSFVPKTPQKRKKIQLQDIERRETIQVPSGCFSRGVHKRI